MPTTTPKLFGILLAAAILAGCGGDGSPTSPRNKGGSRLQDGFNGPGAGMYGPAPGMGLPGMGVPGMGGPAMGPAGQFSPQSLAEGAQLLQATRNVVSTISGFDAQIKTYSQGHYKQGEKVEELRKSTTEARIIWVKPLKLRAEVIQTTNPILVGAAMATSDGENVVARAKGILGLIPIKLKVTDPKLGNNRNHRLPQNNPKAQMDRLTAPTAQWAVVGDMVVEGTPVKLIQVEGTARLDKEVTREVIGIDPQAMTLRKVIMYTGDTKVVDHTMVKFRWNPKVSSASFNL